MLLKKCSNIIDDIDEIKALKRNEEFFSENGVYDSVLNNYKMFEISSINSNMNEEVIDKVLRKTENSYLNSYCFYVSDVNYKTKIRSHKGYINNKLSVSLKNYKEREIDLKNNESFFIGVVGLKENYHNIFDNLFFDSGRCFVFCTNNIVEKEDFIDNILMKKGLSNLFFNYYYLIQTLIFNEEIIIRAAGSDIENGVQIFMKQENDFTI